MSKPTVADVWTRDEAQQWLLGRYFSRQEMTWAESDFEGMVRYVDLSQRGGCTPRGPAYDTYDRKVTVQGPDRSVEHVFKVADLLRLALATSKQGKLL